MIKKKLLAASLILSLSGAVLSGCGAKSVNMTLPQFDESNLIIRSAWWCPTPTAENYEVYKACGLNTIMLANHNFRHDTEALEKDPIKHTMEGAYYIGRPDGFEGETMTDKALALAKEKGLYMILSRGDSYFDWVGYPVDAFEDFTINYEQYKDTIVGLFSGDEPNAPQIIEQAKAIANAEKHFPGVPYFANLFPNYADAENTLKTSTYLEYLNTYGEEFVSKTKNPRLVSVDFYPFIGNNYNTWISNYEDFSDMAKKYDADMHMFIQSAVSADGSHQRLSDVEILVQVNTALAYGANAYSYFLYEPAGEGYPEGLVDLNMNPAPMYYAAQTANKQVASLEKAYAHYDYVDTIPLVSKKNDYAVGAFAFYTIKNMGTFEASQILNDATSTNRALVAILRDKDGNEAFYLTNYFDPGDVEMDEDCTITLSFKNMNKIALYGSSKCLTEEVQDIEKDTFTYTLAPGEGILVIPFKK